MRKLTSDAREVLPQKIVKQGQVLTKTLLVSGIQLESLAFDLCGTLICQIELTVVIWREKIVRVCARTPEVDLRAQFFLVKAQSAIPDSVNLGNRNNFWFFAFSFQESN